MELFPFKQWYNVEERLTWHDSLADQFLSCASLLEFELKDCMKT